MSSSTSDSSKKLPRVMVDLPLVPAVAELLEGHVELVAWPGDGETPPPAIDGIYTQGHPAVDAALLDQLPQVKVISNYGVGVDHIRLAHAAARNIPVGNTPGVLDEATADMAFALLLAAGRRLAEGDRHARNPQVTRFRSSEMLAREVHHRVLGIVGLGRIGGQIARRAAGFSMDVLYHNRRRNEQAEQELGVRYASLDDLLRQADFVVLVVPLTDQTRGLIGRRELALMKPTATLVNIARGAVVDTHALTDALQARRIFAAGLDVTEPEPLPRNHPLLALDNVVLTPHLGSATVETRQRMAELSVENLLVGLRGEPLPCEIKYGP
ncbi:MAG: D-glycerate dehydrogenase [Pirellulales bacterium]